MALEDDLAAVFKEHGWTWNIKNGTIVPDAEDILTALDEAARLLYNEPIDTQLEVGRLIVVKTPRAHDVYIYAGEFQ